MPVSNQTFGLEILVNQERIGSVGGTANVSMPVIVGRFRRGPINKIYRDREDNIYNICYTPDELIERYGDKPDIEDRAWLSARTVLDEGFPVIILRIEHYTAIDNRTTLQALKAGSDLMDSGAVPGLQIKAKWAGDDGNNYAVTTKAVNKISTTLDGAVMTADTKIKITSINLLEVGEVLFLGGTEYVKVKAIYKSLREIELEYPLVNSYVTGASAVSMNFDFSLYYKGDLVEAYQNLSLEAENFNEYIGNVLTNREDIIVDVLGSISTTYPNRMLADVTLSPLIGGNNSPTFTVTDYAGNQSAKTGIWALDGYKIPSLIMMPPESIVMTDDDWKTVRDAYITYCEATQIHMLKYSFPLSRTHTEAIALESNVNTQKGSSLYGNQVYRHPDFPAYTYTSYPLAKYGLRRQQTDLSTTDGGLPNGPYQGSTGLIYGALSVKNVVSMEKVDYAGELITPHEQQEYMEALYRNRINAIERSGALYFVRGSSMSYKGREEGVPFTEESHFATVQDIIAKVQPLLVRYEGLNHTSRLETKVKDDIRSILKRYPYHAFNREDSEGYKVICDGGNNKRKRGSNKLEKPKELNVDIIIDLGDPIKKITLRLKRVL